MQCGAIRFLFSVLTTYFANAQTILTEVETAVTIQDNLRNKLCII